MNKNTCILLLFFFLSVNTLFAQSYIFKVLASSGDYKTNREPKANGKALLVGTKIDANASINISTESYLSLLHSTGGTVQISKAGTYKAKDLETQLLNAKKSVTQKYASFVIGEITKQGEDIAKAKYKYQHVTGSVERATFKHHLAVMLPLSSKVLNSEYTIQWHHLKNTENYIVKIEDLSPESRSFDDIITKDTSCTINIKSMLEKYPDLDGIQLTVSSRERPNTKVESFGLNFLEKEKTNYEKFKNDWKKLEAEAGAAEEAFGKLNQAFFFEEHELLLDAKQAYEDAVRLDPESEAFEAAYNQFLIRRGIGNVNAIIELEKKEN